MAWDLVREIRGGRPLTFRLPEKIGQSITITSSRNAVMQRLRYQRSKATPVFYEATEVDASKGTFKITRVVK